MERRLDNGRISMMQLLEEESRLPHASSEAWYRKFCKEHADNPALRLPRGGVSQKVFSIRHYAGLVKYSPNMFLEKNRDELQNDLCDLMTSVNFRRLSTLFSKGDVVEATNAGAGGGGGGGGGGRGGGKGKRRRLRRMQSRRNNMNSLQ